MRKLLVTIGAGLLAVAALPSASTAGAHDFVVGGGQHVLGVVKEGVSAHSGPLGEDPQGHISGISVDPPPVTQPEQTNGDVICLNVVGNEAFILSVPTHGTFPEGELILTHIVDNGNPVNGESVDLIRNSFLSNGGIILPEFGGGPCGTPVFPPVPVTNGNYLVHDELP
jgi:hypothetical protein